MPDLIDFQCSHGSQLFHVPIPSANVPNAKTTSSPPDGSPSSYSDLEAIAVHLLFPSICWPHLKPIHNRPPPLLHPPTQAFRPFRALVPSLYSTCSFMPPPQTVQSLLRPDLQPPVQAIPLHGSLLPPLPLHPAQSPSSARSPARTGPSHSSSSGSRAGVGTLCSARISNSTMMTSPAPGPGLGSEQTHAPTVAIGYRRCGLFQQG